MSQPTRYDAADLRCKKCQKNVDFFGVLRSHDKGRFVMWDEYATLQAENERLRKAGDLMHRYIYGEHFCKEDVSSSLCSWCKAKGVQS